MMKQLGKVMLVASVMTIVFVTVFGGLISKRQTIVYFEQPELARLK